MSDYTKKKITPLNAKPGDNKADVFEEYRPVNTEYTQHARALMEQAGKMYSPEGADYLGFVVCHYFAKETVAGPTFFTACQISVSKVDEGAAGIGIQTLRQKTMEAYGHKAPKERT